MLVEMVPLIDTRSSSFVKISKKDLRRLIADELEDSIEYHRSSRESNDDGEGHYIRPEGAATEEEVDDFLSTNPMYDFELVQELLEPGLLGFSQTFLEFTNEQLDEILEQTSEWASTKEWVAADLISYHLAVPVLQPHQSSLWLPAEQAQPNWLRRSSTALMLAGDLLRNGRLLSELDWREFEKLIAQLLEREGWNVELTQGSKDGGIDVKASRLDEQMGRILTLWQAKRYGPSNKVQLHHVRELSGLIDKERATKGVILTTSELTRGAIDWIKQDEFRLGFKENQQVEEWVRKHL